MNKKRFIKYLNKLDKYYLSKYRKPKKTENYYWFCIAKMQLIDYLIKKIKSKKIN